MVDYCDVIYSLRRKRDLLDRQINIIEDAQKIIDKVNSNKHPSPINGICKCECNSMIITMTIPEGRKAVCKLCGGDILPNQELTTQNRECCEHNVPWGMNCGACHETPTTS